ncbi:HAD-IIA family hydrolase [Nocardioides pelophilus]|uniref:HAD-IIA family hydrolase n=1 Tax=Nocardioides pelophilus TaxID=2172019 RepID=UPI001601909E|nr:HAD-IIA family hydrolase [Nocardioides pelophilus]
MRRRTDDALRTPGRHGPALVSDYRGVICDLDGVVYRSGRDIAGAIDALNRVVRSRRSIVFATNNASREPSTIGAHLQELGLVDGPWSVATSADVAAHHLAALVPPGSPVLAVGGPGVAAALDGVGLISVRVGDPAAGSVVAVVQGLGHEVTWRELAEVGYLARAGVPWVATNLDPAVPTDRGVAPGNGALVKVVETVAGVAPRSVGKPEPGFFATAQRMLGTPLEQTLLCGDRLDTDIAGARAAGIDSLLVLSGITDLQALASAPTSLRPTFVAPDLGGLVAPARRLLPARDEAIRLADGVPHAADVTDRQRVLEWVVMTSWAVVDSGGQLSDRGEPWRALARQLALP